ncbi:MAG TPA: hypothetical protein P5254_06950, partial [Aquihabitans sp.]|nr:hypothetical protein [Aquihabitans sp.]
MVVVISSSAGVVGALSLPQIDRVRWHLDGADGMGAEVFLAVDGDRSILGHTIVRVEREEEDDA